MARIPKLHIRAGDKLHAGNLEPTLCNAYVMSRGIASPEAPANCERCIKIAAK